jgi:hypothetical protein
MNVLKYLLVAALLGLPVTASAQYYPGQNGDNGDYRSGDKRDNGDYRNQGQVDDVATRLNNRANRLLQMTRNQRGYRDARTIAFYNALRDFARDSSSFRTGMRDWQARRLVNEAENLSRLINRANVSDNVRNTWFRLEDEVSQLSDFYGIPYNPQGGLARTDPYDNSYESGVFRWRGRVDGTDIIYLRANHVDIRHMAAQPATAVSFELPNPLPRYPVNIQLRRLEGRGRIQIVQQPNASNDFTAGVMIEDNQGGSDTYAFELAW